MGGTGTRATTTEEFHEALRKALVGAGPSLIDVQTSPTASPVLSLGAVASTGEAYAVNGPDAEGLGGSPGDTLPPRRVDYSPIVGTPSSGGRTTRAVVLWKRACGRVRLGER